MCVRVWGVRVRCQDSHTTQKRGTVRALTLAHTHTHKLTHAYTHTNTNTHSHTHTHTSTHISTHTHAQTHTRTHTHTRIHTHAHTHAHAHTRTHTHTHAHTQTHLRLLACRWRLSRRRTRAPGRCRPSCTHEGYSCSTSMCGTNTQCLQTHEGRFSCHWCQECCCRYCSERVSE